MQDLIPEGVAWIEGEYLPLAEARIPILDRGFVRSDCTYDVVHVRDGAFFRLADHIARFRASMAGLRLALDMDDDDIAGILTECVRRAGLRDAYVQMTCTRGLPPRGSRDPRLCVNRFYAFAQPFVWIADPAQQAEGLHLIVSSVQRIPPASVDPRLKNFHWLDLTMGTLEAFDRGGMVPVLHDGAGNITEGPGFNLFVVRDGALATPDEGVFEGMTRRTLIEIAADWGLRCELRRVSVAELRAGDEVLLSSTAGGVMPVTRIDGVAVGDGRPGPLTLRLQTEYWDRHRRQGTLVPIDYAAAAS